MTTDSAGNRNPSDTADPDVDLLAFPGSAAGDSIASADSIAPNSGLDITAIDVAESTAGNTESDVHTLLRPNSQDMPSVESPGDPKGIVASGSPSSQADTAPGLDDSPIRLKGAPASSSKLVLEKVDAHALSSRFAVTMTVRNMGDDLAVISNVAFDPLEVLEDISTEFANLAFESTSPTELALLFQSDDNLAQSADEQGSYTRRLPETVNVPANSSIDIRLAIENSDHVGYGLLGRLTLTYDVEQSVTIEDIAIPFVVDQDTLKDADNDADADADADADNQ